MDTCHTNAHEFPGEMRPGTGGVPSFSSKDIGKIGKCYQAATKEMGQTQS